MADTPTDVLVAGYQDIETATENFEGLVALVKDKQVKIDGAILVTHAKDGSVSVEHTGDHFGRKGVGWGGGVGVAVGLAAPPLLASMAVGAAAGGVVGRFADHRVESDARQDRREPAARHGGDHRRGRREERLAVEQALGGLPDVVQSDERGMETLKARSPRLWASSTRTARCSPSRTVSSAARSAALSTTRCRLVDVPGTEGAQGRAQRARRAHRRRRIRRPRHLRRPDQHPEPHTGQDMGVTYNRFHVTACARRPAPPCSPDATSTGSGSARSPSIRARFRATPPSKPRCARRSPAS